MSEELKPCPFCGGKVRVTNLASPDGYEPMLAVKCKICKFILVFDCSEDRNHVSVAWNRRAAGRV